MTAESDLFDVANRDTIAIWNASMTHAREIVESAALLAVQSAHLREEMPPEPITHEQFLQRVMTVHATLHADLLAKRVGGSADTDT